MGAKHTSASMTFLNKIETKGSQLKIVVVGSSNCGKSTFCNAWTQNQQISIKQTITRNHSLKYADINRELSGIWQYKKQQRPFKLWDTKEGCYIYDRLRRSCYRDADIVLICYDISNRKSMQRVREEFVPEICHHEPAANYLLLGLKNDIKPISHTMYNKIIFYWTNIHIENKIFVPNDICHIIIKYAKHLENELVSQNQINEMCYKYKLQSLQCSAVNFDEFKFNNDLYKIAKKWKVDCR